MRKANAVRKWITEALWVDPKVIENLDVDACQTLLALSEDDAFFAIFEGSAPRRRGADPRVDRRPVLRTVYAANFP